MNCGRDDEILVASGLNRSSINCEGGRFVNGVWTDLFRPIDTMDHLAWTAFCPRDLPRNTPRSWDIMTLSDFIPTMEVFEALGTGGQQEEETQKCE